jgi:mannose-6-phosphate isomerase-like protein (cupin superfamily)
VRDRPAKHFRIRDDFDASLILCLGDVEDSERAGDRQPHGRVGNVHAWADTAAKSKTEVTRVPFSGLTVGVEVALRFEGVWVVVSGRVVEEFPAKDD